MWLTPFVGERSGGTWVRVDLGAVVPVTALRLHNYNKSVDDTFRGVKRVRPPGLRVMVRVGQGLSNPSEHTAWHAALFQQIASLGSFVWSCSECSKRG
jgi:hypothetical protein